MTTLPTHGIGKPSTFFPPPTRRLLQLIPPFAISPLTHNRTIINQCLHMPLGVNNKRAVLCIYTSSHHTMRPTLIFITNNSFSSSSSMRCPISFTFILGPLSSSYSWTFLVINLCVTQFAVVFYLSET